MAGTGHRIRVLDKGVTKNLEKLSDETLKKFARRGLGKATRPVAAAAREHLQRNGSVDMGGLRNALDDKRAVDRTGTRAYGIVGPARGARFILVDATTGKRLRVPTKYAHLVEFGTAPHGDHPGASPKPFMRPAFDETAGRAERIINNELLKAMEDSVK